jgi:DNA-binding LytR/AlgR family response regulator
MLNKKRKGLIKPGDLYFIQIGKAKIKIDLHTLDYIESFENYCKYYLNQKPHLSSITLKEIEASFCKTEFIRIHRRFIIPLRKIDKIQDNQVYIKNAVLPIGNTYKEEFFKIINGLN